MARVELESQEKLKQKITVLDEQGRFAGVSFLLFSDEPKDIGGDYSAPAPYDYLLTALASCTAMTIKMYAARKGYLLESVKINLEHKKIPDPNTTGGKIDWIKKDITLHGALSDEEVKRLEEIAEKCPVNKTLKNSVQTETVVKLI